MQLQAVFQPVDRPTTLGSCLVVQLKALFRLNQRWQCKGRACATPLKQLFVLMAMSCNEARHTNTQYAAVRRLLTGVHAMQEAGGTYMQQCDGQSLEQLVHMACFGG